MLRTWIEKNGNAVEINVFELIRMLRVKDGVRFLMWTEYANSVFDGSVSFLALAGEIMPEKDFRSCVVSCHAPGRQWLKTVSQLGIKRIFLHPPHFRRFPTYQECLDIDEAQVGLCRYFLPPEKGGRDVPVCGEMDGKMLLNEWWMRNRCFGNYEACPRYQHTLQDTTE